MKPQFFVLDITAGSVPRPVPEVLAALEDARPTFDGLVLAGGEATMHPSLPAILRAARELGFRYRQVATNGEVLSVAGAAERLAAAGANLFLLTLRGLVPASHDRAVGRRGSFQRVLLALRRLAALRGVHSAARIVLPEPEAAPLDPLSSMLLPEVGARHIVLAPALGIPRDQPFAPLPESAAFAEALRGRVESLSYGPGEILLGNERVRPPLVLPEDGDPYAFRPSAGRAPGLLLLQLPCYREETAGAVYPSLGLARLVGFLDKLGYEARTLDMDVHSLAQPKALEVLYDEALVGAFGRGELLPERLATLFSELLPADALEATGMVGFSVVDPYERYQVDLALALAHWLRRVRPSLTIIAGGDSVEIAKLNEARGAFSQLFDHVIDGQGELGLLGLLNRLEFRDRPLSAVPNRVDRDRDTRRDTEQDIYRNPVIELRRRRLPAPSFPSDCAATYARSPSAALQDFLAERGLPPARPVPTLPFQMVEGCNARCVFCNYTRRLDVLRPEEAADWMVAAAERTGIRQFFGLNPTLNLSRRHALRFANALARHDAGLLWFDSARPIGIDRELAEALRAAGCVMLTFGVDGTSDPVLERMQKGFTVADVESSLAATAAAGIVNRFNLMVGFPYETDADVAAAADFLRRNAENLHSLSCYNPFYLNPWIDLEGHGIAIRRRGCHEELAGSATQAYDEEQGRTWEEKRTAVERDFAGLMEVVVSAHICPHDLPEHDVLAAVRAGLDFWAIRAYISYFAQRRGPRR